MQKQPQIAKNDKQEILIFLFPKKELWPILIYIYKITITHINHKDSLCYCFFFILDKQLSQYRFLRVEMHLELDFSLQYCNFRL